MWLFALFVGVLNGYLVWCLPKHHMSDDRKALLISSCAWALIGGVVGNNLADQSIWLFCPQGIVMSWLASLGGPCLHKFVVALGDRILLPNLLAMRGLAPYLYKKRKGVVD